MSLSNEGIKMFNFESAEQFNNDFGTWVHKVGPVEIFKWNLIGIWVKEGDKTVLVMDYRTNNELGSKVRPEGLRAFDLESADQFNQDFKTWKIAPIEILGRDSVEIGNKNNPVILLHYRKAIKEDVQQ